MENSSRTQTEFITKVPHWILAKWRNTLQELAKVGRDDDVLQVMRINCRFMTELSDDKRKECRDLCEVELSALARQERAIKPPVPIPEWTVEMIRPRIAELEAQYADFPDLWGTGRHEEFPLHRFGQTLLPVHLDANEYIALKQRLAFLSSAVPEHGKDAEGIGVAQAAAVAQHTRQIPSAARKSKTEAARGPKPNMDYHRAIADIVKPFGDDWREQSNLEEIAERLDQDKIPTPSKSGWDTRRPPARKWERAVENYPELVRKALAYSLDMASIDISN